MSRTIPLTKGLFAIVDDEDLEELNKFKWCVTFNGAKYYACRMPSRKLGKRKVILMHRQLTNAPPGMDVDHINGNPLDNRRENLRVCSHADNQKNTNRRSRNKSGYKGVTPSGKRWRARIAFDSQQIEL